MAGRNYKRERELQSTPRELARNAARKKARRKLEAAGKVKKGDGKDVDHKDGNPRNNKRSNLRVQTKAKNRSVARTSSNKKKG